MASPRPGCVDKSISSGHGGEGPAGATEERVGTENKGKIDAFATKQFNQPIKVAEVNRYLIAKFVIDSSQSRAHREMLNQIH